MTPLVVAHPLIPLGGLFFMAIGACLLLGCIVPQLRMALVWIGLALGAVLIVFLGRRYAPPAQPSGLQIASIAVAICVEIAAFVALMPGWRRAGKRRELAGTLVIVGAHFVLMVPAFSAPMLLLSAGCLANAAVGWRNHRYPLDLMWAVDGGLKLSVGAWMWMQSPAFN